MNKQRLIFEVILTIVIIILSSMLIKQCSKTQIKSDIIKDIGEPIKITKDKDGNLVASQTSIVGTKKDVLEVGDTSYSNIKKVLKEKKNVESVVDFTVKTKEKDESKTKVVSKDTTKFARHDTIYECIYPLYIDTIVKLIPGTHDTLAIFITIASKDSTIIMSDIRDHLTLDQHWEKKFFGKKSLMTDIKMYNPNSGIQQMRSYKSEPVKNQFGTGFILGSASGFILRGAIK